MTPRRQRNLAIALGSTALGILIFVAASGSGDDGDRGAELPDPDEPEPEPVVSRPTLRVTPAGMFVGQDDGGWLQLLSHPAGAPQPAVPSDWAAPVGEYFAPSFAADDFALRVEDDNAPRWMLDGLKSAIYGMRFFIVSV